MEMAQELEWKKAQNIAINVDLVAAAKSQLHFLAAVDRNRWLYEGPALDVAIYRYNVYWLPLLAKHSKSPLSEGPLVVPLDCEWIWHCHRLNPVRYKSDCEELYGSVLDNLNVVSSTEGTPKGETEMIWKNMYPDEPYELDSTRTLPNSISKQVSGVENCTKYDLVSAVKRQSPFFYQVTRPHMGNDLYLEGAVARYKGFLHLIKRNRERSIKSFSVPTYDIDLIWHTHQLHPSSYCKDLVDIIGKVLEHDDTDSDRTKGAKLDLGFSGTTKQWEEIYGLRYWRAGAMHKGNAPSPIRTTPYSSLKLRQKNYTPKESQKIKLLPKIEVIEIMLEFVGVKNLPQGHKGSLFVSFSKTQPDAIFNTKRTLTILSESGEKQVACFQCQSTGHLLFELMSCSSSKLTITKPAKPLGSGSISLEDLLSPSSNLTMEKWLELVPSSSLGSSQPICLRVAISATVPTPAADVLHMLHSRPFSKSSCFFPLPGKVQLAKHWTRIIDDNGNEIISLQMRDFKKSKAKNDDVMRKEVIGIIKSGETHTFAEFTGTEWLLMDSSWSLKLPKIIDEEGYILELIGDHTVRFFPGRRLDYEPKHCEKQRNEHDFMTAIEFSTEDPYGRALALLDLKSRSIKVKEEWFLLPGLVLAFIIGEILRKEGKNILFSSGEILKEKKLSDQKVDGCIEDGSRTDPTRAQENVKMNLEVSGGTAVMPANRGTRSGSCGGDCGSGCGNDVRSGACGVKSGNTLKSGGCGGCGGGCGSGCGGCGSGYGAKAGNTLESGACGGCGGGCGSDCGSMTKKGSCGGCGGCGGGGGCSYKAVEEKNVGQDYMNEESKVHVA